MGATPSLETAPGYHLRSHRGVWVTTSVTFAECNVASHHTDYGCSEWLSDNECQQKHHPKSPGILPENLLWEEEFVHSC